MPDLDDTLKQIIGFMEANDIRSIEVDYTAGGDSGEFNRVEGFQYGTGDKEKRSPQSVIISGKWWDTIGQAAWDLVYDRYPGFEIDDGASGTLTFWLSEFRPGELSMNLIHKPCAVETDEVLISNNEE